MKHTYRLEAVKGDEADCITVFSTLEIGSIIAFGADESEPDGIKKWKVLWELFRGRTDE